MNKGIILFGHGSRNPEWALPFDKIRNEINKINPDSQVELAFLELMQPGLQDAVKTLCQAGVRHIDVLPVFISAGSHVREDLPKLVAAAQSDYPSVSFNVLPALGEAPEILGHIAAFALSAGQR